jgi:hypothetical protein
VSVRLQLGEVVDQSAAGAVVLLGDQPFVDTV